MKSKSNIFPWSTAKITSVILAVILFLVSAHLLMQYLNMNIFYQQNGQIYELANRFDLDDEASVPTWFSQALFLVLAVGAIGAVKKSKDTLVKNFWKLVAVIAVLFSLDEIATLHEFVLQSIHVLFFKDDAATSISSAWLLIFPFIFAMLVWFLYSAYKHLPKTTFKYLSVGAVIFIFGAVLVDNIMSSIPRETFLNQGVMVAIEESMELIGILLILIGTLKFYDSE